MCDYIDCLLIGYSGVEKRALEYKKLIENNPAIDHMQVGLNAAISYLGTELGKRDLSFEFINSIEGSIHVLEQYLQNKEILSIGISTTICPSLEQLTKLIKFIKKLRPEIPIILGGALIVYFAREKLKDGKEIFNKEMRDINADYIVNSIYGEDVFAKLVLSLKQKKNCNNIPNLLIRSKTFFYSSPIRDEEYILDERHIDWRLFKGKTGGAVVVRTSLSCCFHCNFCSFHVRAGKYKNVSVKWIEEELNAIERLGEVKLVHFIDDTFNVPLNRFKEILKMFIKNGYSFKWHSYIRCQALDEEAVQLMKESGCIGVFLGLESGSDQVLKAMNKAAKIADYKKGLALLKKYDITIVASFFVGFPGETINTVAETFRFIKEVSPAFYYLGTWFYEPNTPISRYKEQYKLTGCYNNWKHMTMDSDMANKLVMQMKNAIKDSVLLEYLSYPFLFQIINSDITIQSLKKYFKR